MSQLGTIHHFPKAEADRASGGESLRSETPLDVPATPAALSGISGWQSARLAAEVALRGRWPFMVGLLCVSALALPGLLGVREWAQQSAHGMIGMLLFTYGLARGVDGRSQDRAFWAGLGVRPGAWELGTVLVDLAYMGLVAAVGVAFGPEDPVFLMLGLASALVAYGFGSATRSAATTELARFGYVMGMVVVVAANAAVAWALSYGHFVVGLGLQLAIVAAAGLSVRVLLSGVAPESAAGRGRRRWGWLGAALAGLAVLPVQFAQGVPEGTGPRATSRGLLVPDPDPLAGQQVWRLDAAGHPERLPVRGLISIEAVGPQGSFAVRRTGMWQAAEILLTTETSEDAARLVRGGRASRLGLITADADYIECDGPLFDGSCEVDADGMGATHMNPDGSFWRLDADGCRLLPPGDTP